MELTAPPVLNFALPGADRRAGGTARARAVLRDWRDCREDDLLAAWERLVAAAAEPNPFFEPWYLLPSLAALDPHGTVRLLVIERGGEWIGLLPLARERRYYGRPLPHMRNWVHANAFLGAPLIAAGHEAACWEAVLDHADQHPRGALFLHLTGLPLTGPVAAALGAVCAAQGRRHGIVWQEERALLQSPLDADAYLAASLTGKKRKELRRQYTRLAEQGTLTVDRQTGLTGLGTWTTEFLALEQAGWKGAAGSALGSAPATARLFTDALKGAAARGRLERLTLALNGEPIAMLATFLCPPGAFAYKTAFDERFARFSPGVLLQRENLGLLDHPHITWCDSCAAADHPMIDHLWRERRAVGRVSVAIGGNLRRGAFGAVLNAEQRRRGAGDETLAAPAILSPSAPSPSGVFPADTRAAFAAAYPEVPHILTHTLGEHPLLELEALAGLAERLPPAAVEYNFADLPIGIDAKPPPTGIPIGETIRQIEATGSWAALKNVEQDPAYAALLHDLLGELQAVIEPRTGAMLKLQAFIFITSPNGVTPYHFDPEHNILMQIRGTKVLTQFPAGDPRFAPDRVHETYHTGGGRELTWGDDLLPGGTPFALAPGQAVYVPVMAPHFVRNGPQPSVSLSITWRSDWSFAEADARAFNGVLRRLGLRPAPTGRWPARNRVKALAWRAMRRLSGGH